MSYFEGLKLTKKGEQLQAKINGNLSETLTFTKAKLGSGSITSNDEIRFLTDVKEVWGTANVTSCKIQGDEKNIVAIELQFSNAELREDKIFREIGLYAQGNEGEEILYAYANAGDKYDYIPLMKDSPHSFIIVIYFNITSGSKVDAKIDLHSYVSLQEFNEGMNKKVNKTDYASAEQYGIVKYGTQENTALEGNKFTQMMGKDYGGILNEIGLKEVGKTYFDKNTKKLYLCKNNNSDISANINNYIAMDSHSILERLENLDRNLLYKIDRWSPKDEDELIKTGIFQIKGATSKLKLGFCGSQCFVLVFNTSVNGDDYVTQIAFSYYDTFSIAIRTRNGDTKQWTPWRYLSAN